MLGHKNSPFYVLRHRNFRLLWIGLLISRIGSEMQVVGMNWHVYLLTGSAFSLGIIGLSRFLPVFMFSLIGGMTADIFNRKKIMFIAQVIMTLCALVLTIATMQGFVSPLLIYVTIALTSFASAFDTPSRQAIVPLLVPKNEFVKATSLNTTMWQAAIVIGPSLAGFTIAYLGIGYVYLINTISFIAVIIAIVLMSPIPQIIQEKVEFNIESIKEGLSFVFKTPIIVSTMLLDFFAMFFASGTVLMPIYAKEILNVGPEGLGFLYAAPAIGAVVAGLYLSAKEQVKNQGKILLSSVMIFAIAMILFGISKNFLLSLVFLCITGAADAVSSVIRNTIRQLKTPDHLRGRMVSINQIFFYGGPQLGEVEAGIIAGFTSAPIAAVTGGIATLVATGIIAVVVPQIRKYKGHEHVEVI